MTTEASGGARLAHAHAGRFRIVPYAELRAKATQVAGMIARRYAGGGRIVIAPILGGGGLPARLIVDGLLGFGVVQAVVPCQIRRYSGVDSGGEIELLLPLSRRRVTGQVVIGVDDLVDGGQTLAAFRAHAFAQGAREVETAAIYAKPHSTELPEYCAEHGVRQWMVLPGEELDFMSELVNTDAELRALDAQDRRVYFETMGLPGDTVSDWTRLHKNALTGVQW